MAAGSAQQPAQPACGAARTLPASRRQPPLQTLPGRLRSCLPACPQAEAAFAELKMHPDACAQQLVRSLRHSPSLESRSLCAVLLRKVGWWGGLGCGYGVGGGVCMWLWQNGLVRLPRRALLGCRPALLLACGGLLRVRAALDSSAAAAAAWFCSHYSAALFSRPLPPRRCCFELEPQAWAAACSLPFSPADTS